MQYINKPYRILSLYLFLQIFSTINTRALEIDNLFLCKEMVARPTNNSITLHACSFKELEVFYEYGLDSNNLDLQTQTIITKDSIPFVIKIENLESNKKYYYRLNYKELGTLNNIKRPIYYFVTQKPKGSTFKFAIEADPHLDSNSIYESFELTLQNILNANPDFLVDLGDTFMSEKLEVKSQTEITKRHILLRNYFDLICHSTPLFLALGNHEGELGWQLNGKENSLPVLATNTRKKYFSNPEPNIFYSGNLKEENFVGLRQNYYSFEWGDALIVVLDPFWYTEKKPAWGWTLGQEQYEWFKNTLETSNSKFKFVFCHNLLGGSGNEARGGSEFAHLYETGGFNTNLEWEFDKFRPNFTKPIHQLMVENGVSIFFHGHDHFYAKQEKDGIVYQLVPQPSNRNIKNTSATQYGYNEGIILPGRGYLLMTINDTIAQIDYIKTLLANEEKNGEKNKDIAYSYTIKPSITNGLNNNKDELDNVEVYNYPNPFSELTHIKYKLEQSDYVQLKVYNIFGIEITTLVNEIQNQGIYNYKIDFLNFNLPSGMYYYSLTFSNKTITKYLSYRR